MKFVFILPILLLPFISQAQGIEFFNGSWEEALELAKEEDKIIFVDAYAKWCGPCKKMAATSFKDADVGNFHKENFISLKIDMEDSMGRKFGQTYRVSAYPTLFYIDGDGNIVKKSTGFRQAAQLIKLGNEAIKGYDKSGQYAVEYEKGNRDYNLVYNYVKELNKVSKPSLKIANDYLNSNPEITKEQRNDFVYIAMVDADSKIFDEFIDNKSDLEKKYGKEVVMEKVSTACFKTIEKSIEFEFPELKDEAVKQFKSAYPKEANKFEYKADLYCAEEFYQFKDWKEINKKFLKKYGKKDASAYKASISTLKNKFKKLPESKILWLEYAENLVALDGSTENYLDYITALLENDENAKALEVAQEALKQADLNGTDTSQINRYLKYIETL